MGLHTLGMGGAADCKKLPLPTCYFAKSDLSALKGLAINKEPPKLVSVGRWGSIP